MNEEEKLRRDRTAQWMKRRQAEVAKRPQLEAAGRRVYQASAMSGRPVAARTPAELRALGEAHGQQLRAGASGAVDEFTLGAADPVLAGVAALASGGLSGIRQRYDANMRQKRAEDAYDERHYRAARTSGRVAGAVAGIAAGGGVARGAEMAAVKLAPSIAKVAPRAARLVKLADKTPVLKDLHRAGLTRMSAVGGATGGLLSQVASDAATGHVSSLGDYAGAVIGGAAGGLATLYGGVTTGGAAGGAATSMAQAALNGRGLDPVKAAQAARSGAAVATAAGVVGKYGSAALPPKAKGELGETLSRAKTVARGERVGFQQHRVGLKGGGTTVIDHGIGAVAPTKIVEAKFGPTARLSGRQRQAQTEYGPDYLVDAWQFHDVAKALGGAAAPLGGVDGTPDPRLRPTRLR